MAELTQQERLQPSLLDRLTDEHPEESSEPSHKRFLTVRQLRDAVIRDLQWLLNTSRYSATSSLDDYPELEKSVLNYGIPGVSGALLSGVDIKDIERLIKQAIIQFEPRIMRRTLQVQAIVDSNEMSTNALTFEISGDVWGQPAAVHLTLKTELDLERGTITIADFGG